MYRIILLLMYTASAAASHHGWAPVEAFSNADGTLQYIELGTSGNNETALTCCGNLEAANTATSAFKEFTFPSNLSNSQTAGKRLLLATAGFEAAHGVKPDFIIEDNFLTITAGDVWYNSTLSWSSLPSDGWQSYNAGGSIAAGTPKNFAGTEVTLSEPVAATNATQYLMTKSTSANVTTLHIVNTSDEAQSFTGTLYNGAGEQQGSAGVALHSAPVASKGRVKLTAGDLEMLFSVDTWSGPAMLEVQGVGEFVLMGKLVSPSGLVSNTNCVRETRVLNIEGSDSSDNTFVRFINTGSSALGSITGTLYDANGNVIGASDTEIMSSLAAKSQVWVNRSNFETLFGATWTGEAMLEVGNVTGLKLLNLNFVNGETFFNFSCFETSGSGAVYLMTNAASANVSNLHIVNTSSLTQVFRGSLYNGDGEQQGSASVVLHSGVVQPKGRIVLNASDIETLFGVGTWSGPAVLNVTGSYDFELMIKLESPSGLISNTNCVRQNEVHNIEGFDSEDMTFVRFINVGSTAMGSITGTLYDSDGTRLGNENTELLSSLAAKGAVWLNRTQLSAKFNNETWNGEALLKVNGTADLRLLNLNFANSETFFNFSCYESSN